MADSQNIWAATIPETGAAIAVADLGSTLPTDTTTELDAAFADLGWVNEDGVTNSVRRDVTRHKAWSGQTVKTTMDNYEETLKFSLLESSVDVLQAVFGFDNVSIDGTTVTVDHSDRMLDRQSFVVSFADGDATGRIIVKEGLITELGDIKYDHKALTEYELTVDVYKPDDGSAAVTVILDNPNVTPGS
jgi:hypothetical protein